MHNVIDDQFVRMLTGRALVQCKKPLMFYAASLTLYFVFNALKQLLSWNAQCSVAGRVHVSRFGGAQSWTMRAVLCSGAVGMRGLSIKVHERLSPVAVLVC